METVCGSLYSFSSALKHSLYPGTLYLGTIGIKYNLRITRDRCYSCHPVSDHERTENILLCDDHPRADRGSMFLHLVLFFLSCMLILALFGLSNYVVVHGCFLAGHVGRE